MANKRYSDITPKKDGPDTAKPAARPSGRTLPKSNPGQGDFKQRVHLPVKGPGDTPKA